MRKNYGIQSDNFISGLDEKYYDVNLPFFQ